MLRALCCALLLGCSSGLGVGRATPSFKVVAFFTGKQDQAHISFVREANAWFPEMARRHGFGFDTTSVQELRGRHGIMGMRERAEQVGGLLQVQSRPGEGTQITVMLP